MDKSKIEITDGRKLRTFWADNDIFDKWGHELKLSGITVYLCLVRHANKDGTCFPSFNTIARKCGTSRSTVIRTIDRLIQLGLIDRVKRTIQNSKEKTSNLYIIKEIPAPPGVSVTPPPSVSVTPPSVSVTPPPSVSVTPPIIIKDNLPLKDNDNNDSKPSPLPSFFADLLPPGFAKPSVCALIKKHQAKGEDYIRQAIAYSNDNSRKATWQSYKSFLGRALDEGWGDGYESGSGTVPTVSLAGKYILYQGTHRKADDKGTIWVGSQAIHAEQLAKLVADGKAHVKEV